MVFRATTVNISQQILLNGLGFSGGPSSTYTAVSQTGYGIDGESGDVPDPQQQYGGNPLMTASGGGGRGSCDGSGAGGSAAQPAQVASMKPTSCAPNANFLPSDPGVSDPQHLLLGAGGGAGGAKNKNVATMIGGAGGGVAVIFSNVINFTGLGSIHSVGSAGQSPSFCGDGGTPGSAGGGAGGSILLIAQQINGIAALDVSGGFGGSDTCGNNRRNDPICQQ